MTGTEGHPALSYQPVRLLFQLGYTCTIIARLPVWVAVSSATPLRPHPKWNAKQTLLSRAVYAAVDMESRIGITEKLSLEPGKEGERFQVAQPAASTLYKGPLESETTKPAPVGGTWFPQAPKEDIITKTVVLYVHGGAFIKGSGRDAYIGFPSKTLIARGGVDAVYAVQYRLSGWSGLNPFPAALQDTLTAYLYLLNLKIPPQQIVLCGDSAGANLVIALLRYIQEFGAELDIKAPRSAILASPWVAPLEYNIEASPRFKSDFLPSSFLRWGAETYTASLSNPTTNPYVTPLGSPFATPVPIFVNAGTAEIFLDVINQWVDEMKKTGNNQIEYHQEDGALHDTFLVANLLGFEESAEEVVSVMGAFIRKF